MLVIKPKIFDPHPGVLCGISTKIGLNRKAPFYFNLSYSVNDDPEAVTANRRKFFSTFDITEEKAAFQKQVHGDNISFPETGGSCGESDAMITAAHGLGLAVSTADCPSIFIFDPVNWVIAAVHSGWRSTEKEIVKKVVEKMVMVYNSRASNLIAYIGPSICASCYEVGQEFNDKFAAKYLNPAGEKFMLDLPQRNLDMLQESGIPRKSIQLSELCTFEMKDMLHSYRRDGEYSGRAIGLIVMRR